MRLVHVLPPSFDGPLASTPKYEAIIEHDSDNQLSRPATPAMSTISRYSAWWVDEDSGERSPSPAPSSHYARTPSPLRIRRSHSLLSRVTHLRHAGSRTLSSSSGVSLASHQILSSGHPACPYHGGCSLPPSDTHSLLGRSQLPETTWCSPPVDRPTYIPVSQLRDAYTPPPSVRALTSRTVDLYDEPNHADGALLESAHDRGSADKPEDDVCSLRSHSPSTRCSPDDVCIDNIARMTQKLYDEGQSAEHACTCSQHPAADTIGVIATSPTLFPPFPPVRPMPRRPRKKWLGRLLRTPKVCAECRPCDAAGVSLDEPTHPRSLLLKRRKPHPSAKDAAGSRWLFIKQKMKRLVKVLSTPRPHVNDLSV